MNAGCRYCCNWGPGAYFLYVNGVLVKQGGKFRGVENTTFPNAAQWCGPSGGEPFGANVLDGAQLGSLRLPYPYTFPSGCESLHLSVPLARTAPPPPTHPVTLLILPTAIHDELET